MAATFATFLDAFMVGVSLYYQPHVSPDQQAIGARDVANDIVRFAGVTHPGLVDDIVHALEPAPQWMRREVLSGNQIEQLPYSWERFKHLVKHEMRFFFATKATGSGDMTAMQLLEAVSDVGQHNPAVWPAPCPPTLFRARMATSESEAAQWHCAADLGSPPPGRAASNRMSPAGISFFYGASDRVTAIAEAASHTACRYVVTGEFTATRRIRLIDLTNLPDLPSIFDPTNHKQYFPLRFLHKFVHDITLPVELDGREHIDYVPTQVFTEYMRYAFPEAVDGLIFPSTQGPGSNIVIFFGPDRCADTGTETASTRLSLDPATVKVSRVMTVAR